MTITSAAETWDAIYRSGRDTRMWPSEDVIRFCARRLRPGMRVLEAGCGNGANLWYLTTRRCLTVGVDCSNVALVNARLLCDVRDFEGHNLLTLRQGTLGRLLDVGADDYASKGAWQFDAIIDCRASQHTPWSQHAVIYREYFELLKPGGWLFLMHLDSETIPDADQQTQRTVNEQHTWDDIDAGVYPHNGLVCMPRLKDLVECVSEAGLLVRRREQITRDDYVVASSHTAIDAQRPEK